MMSRGRNDGEEQRVVSDALALLRGLPEIAADETATLALNELARRVDPMRLGKAQRFAQASKLVNASLDVEAVLRNCLRVAVEVMDAERGFIVLREGRIATVHNLDRAALENDEEPAACAIAQRVLDGGEAVFASDPPADLNRPGHAPIVSLHVRSIACVPLRVRGEVIGAIYLDSRTAPGAFAGGDRETLASFAHQAALAIENARMFAQERERVARISALQAFQTRILEAIANGVITLSAKREITTFNRAAETTFGIATEKMVGKAAFAIAASIPDFPELLDTFFISGAVSLRAEVEAQRSDGKPLVLEIRLSPLASPGGTGVAIVVTDVTQQRILEEAHAAEVQKAVRIQESFSRYLAPHVVQSLMHDPDSIRLGGERSRATMFFADVRGFTSMAATLPPERVVEILNAYFDEAVRIVFDHEGLLDKFYGDGVMAVFGPPRVRGDDAARAVSAAIALHDVVARLGPRIDYPLQISVGLATGEVVAGHFGSAKRMDYTVIGDAVNLASGLQSAAPAGAIYCDAETIAAAGTISRPLHRLAARVKGRSELVTAYAIYAS
jgi:adenylate cyclase